MALQSFTVSIGALRDVNNNDKNYVSGEAIYVKTIGGTFAPIFRDLAGTSEIAQDGLANQTNEKGQFTFFVEAGDYILEYQNQSTPVTIVGADYFNNRVEETVNQIIIDTSTSRGFRVVGDFASGFTYELPNDVAIDGSGNYWVYADINALPVTVSAGTTPSEPTYTQVTFNQASGVTTTAGINAQQFIDNFELKIFQSPTDNLTKVSTFAGGVGVVYEVRKTSDNSLATIYSDKDGVTSIPQNGTANVSNGDAEAVFYIADGSYNITINAASAWFKTLTASSISLAVKDAISQNPATVQDAIDWYGIFVEEFRQGGDTDSDVIIKALQYISNLPYTGTRLVFERGRDYTWNSTHYLYNINNMIIDLNGAYLKRADGVTTSASTTAEITVSSDTQIKVDDASKFKVNDYITAFTSKNDADTNRDPRKITAINGNTITIAAPFFFSPVKTTLPIGTTIAKVVSLFLGRPSSTDSTTPLTAGINEKIFIINGTIDGNRANQLNVSWRFSTEIALHSKMGIISGVKFQNICAETVVGHGIKITDCIYEDIGGSCYHLSKSDQTLALGGRSWFIGNEVRRTNLEGNTAVGHSEGMITFSWGAGNLIVADNHAEDLNEYFIGSFTPSTGANPDRLLNVYGNTVDTAKGIFDAIQTPVEGVAIHGNIFHDCGNNIAKTQALATEVEFRFEDNTLSGNTTAYQVKRSDRLKVGFSSYKHEFTGGQWSYEVGTLITTGTPTAFASYVNTIKENDGNLYEAFYSTVAAGFLWHTNDGGGEKAIFQFNPSDGVFDAGTNIESGEVNLRTGLFQKALTLDDDGVAFPQITDGSNKALHIGDKNTDGSWRIILANGDLKYQKRVAGTWVTKQTVSGA